MSDDKLIQQAEIARKRGYSNLSARKIHLYKPLDPERSYIAVVDRLPFWVFYGKTAVAAHRKAKSFCTAVDTKQPFKDKD